MSDRFSMTLAGRDVAGAGEIGVCGNVTLRKRPPTPLSGGV